MANKEKHFVFSLKKKYYKNKIYKKKINIIIKKLIKIFLYNF